MEYAVHLVLAAPGISTTTVPAMRHLSVLPVAGSSSVASASRQTKAVLQDHHVGLRRPTVNAEAPDERASSRQTKRALTAAAAIRLRAREG